MYKIKSVKFINHPILKNLELDFSGSDGHAVDTVILAGENGTGKSTILNYLYGLFSGRVKADSELVLEGENDWELLAFRFEGGVVKNNAGDLFLPIRESFLGKYQLSGIYSDVDINFHASNIMSVTSLKLDESAKSRRSGTDLPQQIKQLIIDVQALDDTALASAIRTNPQATIDELKIEERMLRFTNAFSQMFDDLKYDRIETENGHKEIYFKKHGADIPIDSLSSGEKQIVYRGCFLLKDINATNGAFVFIDEPEISLHPNWQKKIMDYYKGIFSDKDGKQTSQIFAVTHSPFIIHNENRRNDKVIVLARNEDGEVIVKDKPEYYKCDSVEAVIDAFSIKDFSADQPTVYLEGRTDEKYFNRAVQVYGLDVPFRFKWVGYMDDRGQEVNTGEKSINAAYQFLVGRNLPVRNFCLKDCDTKRVPIIQNNVIIMAIPPYLNAKGIKKGIENALVLDDVDLSPYYSEKETMGNYGEKNIIQELNKMECCDGICAMDNDCLKVVFTNLKTIIERMTALYYSEEW